MKYFLLTSVLCVALLTGCGTSSILGGDPVPLTAEEQVLVESAQGRILAVKARIKAASSTLNKMHLAGQVTDTQALEYVDKIEEANDKLSLATINVSEFKLLAGETNRESALMIVRDLLILTGN